MRINLRLFCLSTILLLAGFQLSFGQGSKPSKTEKKLYKQAFNKLDLEYYEDAIKDYKQLLEMNPRSSQYNFEIGVAYLRSPKEFSKAEEYFEKALQFSTEDTIEELFYYLGKSYQSNHKFAEAKESYKNFDRFIKPSKAGAQLKSEVDWLEKTCNHGEYHVKLNTKNPLENKSKPVDNVKKYFLNATDYVIMQNMGDQINSVNDEHGAVMFNEEVDIFFTSKRNPFANPQQISYGKDFEQIYTSKWENDQWNDPKLISSLSLFSSEFNDASSHLSMVAVNKDENEVILYKNTRLYYSKKENGDWTAPDLFPSHINLKKSNQPSAFLSDDGKTLIVVSDKNDGYGGTDMYTCAKDENGEWGELVNMGSVVNTEQDENTPFMVGNDLLYFSSKGHSAIGGYDVFYSKKKNGEWTNPQSLGIPINTPQDEVGYTRSKLDAGIAYYASGRVDGYGYKDIYKINSYYKTKKREDLPNIAMTDFLSDELKTVEKEKETAQTDVKAPDASTEVAIAAVPVATKDDEPKKEEPKVEEPKETTPVVVAPKKTVPADKDLFRDILFKFNGNELTADSEEQVKKIAQYMKENPNYVVSLSGHADYLGSDEVNDRVSEQRALVVVNKLINAGADPYNVNYSYYGERKPKVDGKNPDGSDNPAGRAQNRRVEFELAQLQLFRVVTFGSNQTSLSADAKKNLADIAKYMKSSPSSRVMLSGFSDSVGNADYNKQLSEKRVKAAEQELKGQGIEGSRISTEFFGEERPSAPGTNSRRVEIRVQ